MEAMADAVEQTDLCVLSLDQGVGESVDEGRLNAWAVVADRSGEFDERPEPAATGPREPGIEELIGPRYRFFMKDCTEPLLQQVGPVDRGVLGGKPAERPSLLGREILWVLPEGPPGVLEVFGLVLAPPAPEVVPHLTSDLVERLGGNRCTDPVIPERGELWQHRVHGS